MARAGADGWPQAWLMRLDLLEHALKCVYGQRYALGVSAAAALADGDLAQARRLAALVRLPPLPRPNEDLASLHRDLVLCRSDWSEHPRVALADWIKYRPDQPRVPAGSPDGGQWTEDPATGDSIDASLIGDANDRPLLLAAAGGDPDPKELAWREAQKALRRQAKQIAKLITRIGWIRTAAELIEYLIDNYPDIVQHSAEIWAASRPPRPLDEAYYTNEYIAADSFASLKKRLRPSQPGYEPHHIVEESQISDQIPAWKVHNTNNVIEIPKFKHEEISAHYSSTSPDDPTKTVREWLKDKSYDEQRAYGLKYLRQIGVLK